jgi:hypothetical protein
MNLFEFLALLLIVGGVVSCAPQCSKACSMLVRLRHRISMRPETVGRPAHSRGKSDRLLAGEPKPIWERCSISGVYMPLEPGPVRG